MEFATQPPSDDDSPSLSSRGHARRSALVSRNVIMHGRRTSVRLEPDIWAAIADICKRENIALNDFCVVIAKRKAKQNSMASAIRTFIVAYYQAAATEEGHARVGHGRGLF